MIKGLRNIFLFTVSLLVTAGTFPAFASPSPWIKENQTGDIFFYSRTPAGARVKEFLAVAEVQASVPVLWLSLRDISAYPSWFGDCLAAEEISRDSENRIFYYLLMKTAGPLRNREIYAEALYYPSSDNSAWEIRMRDAPQMMRKSSKKSRPIKSLSASCILTPLTTQRTKVEYSLLLDPGEEIPAGLSNLYVLGQMEKIMTGLIRIVGQKY